MSKVSELFKLQKGQTMNSRVHNIIALSAVTLGLCGVLGGCSPSSHHYSYETPDYINYSSVYLSLKINDQLFEKLQNITSTNIYAYNSSGARVSASTGIYTPKAVKGNYTFTFFCNTNAQTLTLDYFDVNGDFLGCSTVSLPELGENFSEGVDVEKIYDKTAATNAYTLKIRELSATKEVNGKISLDKNYIGKDCSWSFNYDGKSIEIVVKNGKRTVSSECPVSVN